MTNFFKVTSELLSVSVRGEVDSKMSLSEAKIKFQEKWNTHYFFMDFNVTTSCFMWKLIEGGVTVLLTQRDFMRRSASRSVYFTLRLSEIQDVPHRSCNTSLLWPFCATCWMTGTTWRSRWPEEERSIRTSPCSTRSWTLDSSSFRAWVDRSLSLSCSLSRSRSRSLSRSRCCRRVTWEHESRRLSYEGHIREHQGTSRNIRTHQGTLRNIRTHQGTSRNIREHQGTSGNIKGHQDTSGNIREHQGTSGNIREHQGTLRDIRTHQGTSGNIKEHQDTSGNIREH